MTRCHIIKQHIASEEAAEGWGSFLCVASFLQVLFDQGSRRAIFSRWPGEALYGKGGINFKDGVNIL